VAQQVEGGDEVAPLHQLPQGPAAEGVLRDLEARLLGEQAQVHQDLRVAAVVDVMAQERERETKTLNTQ